MTNTNPPQVSTVHDAVVEAKFDGRDEESKAAVCKSFRVEENVFLSAQEILSRNGTTVSKFCRAALVKLCKDYGAMFYVDTPKSKKRD